MYFSSLKTTKSTTQNESLCGWGGGVARVCVCVCKMDWERGRETKRVKVQNKKWRDWKRKSKSSKQKVKRLKEKDAERNKTDETENGLPRYTCPKILPSWLCSSGTTEKHTFGTCRQNCQMLLMGNADIFIQYLYLPTTTSTKKTTILQLQKCNSSDVDHQNVQRGCPWMAGQERYRNFCYYYWSEKRLR